MVLNLQESGYLIYDPKIASTELVRKDNQYMFRAGNLSTKAITTFFDNQKCNMFCNLIGLKSGINAYMVAVPVFKCKDDNSAEAVQQFFNWTEKNKMVCNPEKCHELIFRKKRKCGGLRNYHEYFTM